MTELFSEAYRRDPYPLLARLREHAPVFHHAASGTWMLLADDDVKRALANHDAFSSAVPPPGTLTADWLIFTDPPRHARLRALIMRALGARRANDEMRGYLPTLIEERRARARDDLLSRLVSSDVDGERLSDDEILGFFQLLLLAGHETTTNLLANAVLLFDEHPDQLALLRAASWLSEHGAAHARRGQSRSGALRSCGHVRHHARSKSARRVRARDSLLHRRTSGPPRGTHRAR